MVRQRKWERPSLGSSMDSCWLCGKWEACDLAGLFCSQGVPCKRNLEATWVLPRENKNPGSTHSSKNKEPRGAGKNAASTLHIALPQILVSGLCKNSAGAQLLNQHRGICLSFRIDHILELVVREAGLQDSPALFSWIICPEVCWRGDPAYDTPFRSMLKSRCSVPHFKRSAALGPGACLAHQWAYRWIPSLTLDYSFPLLQTLAGRGDGSGGSYCPHGRPVCIEFLDSSFDPHIPVIVDIWGVNQKMETLFLWISFASGRNRQIKKDQLGQGKVLISLQLCFFVWLHG